MLGKHAHTILILVAAASLSAEETAGFHVQPVQVINSDFADYLYANCFWDRAATEYMRLIHNEEGDTLALPLSSLRLARCWQELRDYEASLDMYLFLSERLDSPDLRASALFGAGSVFEEMGIPASARTLYLQASSASEDLDIRDRSRILAALSAGTMDDWARAGSELQGVAAMGGPGSKAAASLAVITGDGEHLPHRSPFWCGVSSAVIPGSGQIICGNTTDGLVALGTNVLLGCLFAVSLHEENTTTSVVLGWVGLSFYGGNIYGGSRAAERYNYSRRSELLDRITTVLEEDYPGY